MRKNTLIIIGVIVVVIVVIGVGIAMTGESEPASDETSTTTTATSSTKEDVTKPSRDVIGTSVEGRDITAYTLGDGPQHVVLAGGIHGGYEWNAVLLSRKLVDHFEENPKLIRDNLTVTVIPVLNPDGLYEVVGTTGPFTAADAPAKAQTESGRFNANGVDLNRNFACNWQSTSTWSGRTVDAGTSAFSEPEARAMRDYTKQHDPDAVLFMHSAANGVYGSSCNNGILAETQTLMNTYAEASGYPAIESFDHYEITGDGEGWHAKLGVPSVSVELTNHEDLEWERNLAGVKAVLKHYAAQSQASARATSTAETGTN